MLHRVAPTSCLVALFFLVTASAWAEDADHAPPFAVTGTVIANPTRIATVILLDGRGKALGEMLLREGDIVEGYSVAAIQEDAVLFDRGGHTFAISVAHTRSSISTAAEIVIPYERRKGKVTNVIPPPDNIDDIKRQSEVVIHRLQENQQFRRSLEEVRRRLRERLENPKASP